MAVIGAVLIRSPRRVTNTLRASSASGLQLASPGDADVIFGAAVLALRRLDRISYLQRLKGPMMVYLRKRLALS